MSDDKSAVILSKGILKIQINDMGLVINYLEKYPIEHALKIIREYYVSLKKDLEKKNGTN